MKKKAIVNIFLSGLLAVLTLAGCAGKPSGYEAPDNIQAEQAAQVQELAQEPFDPADYHGTVRWLNYKPEAAGALEHAARMFEEETGIHAEIETAASGTYQDTLHTRFHSENSPGIFVCANILEFERWKDYCADLTDTQLASWIRNKSYSLREKGHVYGISYALEGWGIMVNESITDRYFASDHKNTPYTSLHDLYSFEALKAVVEDMQAMKEELGIDGVFAAVTLAPGEDWRYQTHLLNQALYWEWKDQNISLRGAVPEFQFTYSDNYKNILDLYLNNSCTERSEAGTMTVDESMSQFAYGKCAMVQNGDWSYSTIRSLEDRKVRDEDLCFIPITCGVPGEEKMGLSVGASQYMCINNHLPVEDQKAALAFLEWLFGSETGKKITAQELEFFTPFKTMNDAIYLNPLFASETEISAKGKEAYPWYVNLIPSETWKRRFGDSLLAYALGEKQWEDVVREAVSSWKEERNAVD